ncbi:MAG: hypothetical protein V7644_399 [Actinomycetota bacterium]|jgi:hypothetical protein
MSVSAPAAEACPSCGASLPGRGRYCPECGAPVEEPLGETRRTELPPAETGPVPVSLSRAETRWFGLPPALLLLAAAATSFLLAVVLFATGHWPYGLILLGVAALLLAAFLELVRRRPHPAAGRTGSDVRERAGSAWEAWRARTAVSAEARRVQGRLMMLEAERRAALLELGEAAYGGDGAGETSVRGRLAALDLEGEALRRRLQEQLEQAEERIRKARLPVQETVMVMPNQPAAPYPPPDEGNPPQPAIVPEPYPPPDEGTPPQPAPVPEPQPREDS